MGCFGPLAGSDGGFSGGNWICQSDNKGRMLAYLLIMTNSVYIIIYLINMRILITSANAVVLRI